MSHLALQHKYLSRNHEFLQKGITMSEIMTKMLERLAEMFPRQDYHSRLEKYLESKCVKSVGDVEHWSREFDLRQRGSVI